MALPVIETPTFELTLPSADKKLKYRPFLVKEEKVLLQALESGEDSDIKQAIKDCVQVCTFGEVDGGQIPTFDLEFIFLNIRKQITLHRPVSSQHQACTDRTGGTAVPGGRVPELPKFFTSTDRTGGVCSTSGHWPMQLPLSQSKH